MAKRLFDLFFSFFGLIIISPLFLLISISIILNSKGGIFYKQFRVGKNNIDFKLLKFRSMFINSDKQGLLTIGSNDNRVTSVGLFIRKYKLDELPQLINILKGDMSFVGPRPEVRKYVDMYTQQQLKVLSVKPGLTDFASLEYFNENDILAKEQNPEECYIKIVMPAKIELNFKYIKNPTLLTDIILILKTIKKVIIH